MNNSVYGKTMGNSRKREKVRLVNNVEDYKKYVSKPSFVSQEIFSKILLIFIKVKPVLTLDKPVYVGFSILDLSKLLMFEFHYKYIELKYDNSTKLLFTDTDSIVYEIEPDDVYENFYEKKHLFDFSDRKIVSMKK